MHDTFSDAIGDLAAKLAQTPSRELPVLEQVRSYDGQIVTWTMAGDFAMASILVVAVRVSHPEAKIVLDGTPVALGDLPEHGTVRLPRPVLVRAGRRIDLDPGPDGSIELLGKELPVRPLQGARDLVPDGPRTP